MLFKSCGAFLSLVAMSVLPAFGEAADLGPYRPAKSAPGAYIPPPPSETYVDEAPSFSWTGAFMGFSAGYGWGDTTFKSSRGTASSEPEGVLGSYTLGYNYQLPSGMTLGVEGDVGLMDLSTDDGSPVRSAYGDRWGTIRGRLGFAAGRTLFYGTGGAAFMDLDEVALGAVPGGNASNEDFKSGYVIGGGLEHALSNHITAKIEYLYMDFGTFEGLSSSNQAFQFDNTVDLVRAGINYKF